MAICKDDDARLLQMDLSVCERFKSFWSRVQRTRGCWNWTGWLGENFNRPMIRVQGKDWLVSRLIWTLLHGPIPPGKCVLHKCDNTRCIRPSHFFLGTRDDNNKDRAAKGRSACLRGEANGNSKLTQKQVGYILSHFRPRSKGVRGNVYDLAAKFHVHYTQIHNIVRGRQWRS